MAEKFPNLMTSISPLIQVQTTPSRITTKKNTPKKMMVQLLKNKNRDKILKADRKQTRHGTLHTVGVTIRKQSDDNGLSFLRN